MPPVFDPARGFPSATLVTNDSYDRASNLSRPSILRLNIGVGKDTYRTVFGPQPPRLDQSRRSLTILPRCAAPPRIYGILPQR